MPFSVCPILVKHSEFLLKNYCPVDLVGLFVALATEIQIVLPAIYFKNMIFPLNKYAQIKE